MPVPQADDNEAMYHSRWHATRTHAVNLGHHMNVQSDCWYASAARSAGPGTQSRWQAVTLEVAISLPAGDSQRQAIQQNNRQHLPLL